jgi:hypothetical protein
MESAGGEARPPVLLPPVQELAGQLVATNDVPARYVARAGAVNDDRKAMETAPVPAIDLARLCQSGGDGGADDEASMLRLALQSWGLFLVRTHAQSLSGCYKLYHSIWSTYRCTRRSPTTAWGPL